MRLNGEFKVSLNDELAPNLAFFVTEVELFFLVFASKSETIYEESFNRTSFSSVSSYEFSVTNVGDFFLEEERNDLAELLHEACEN